MAKKPVTDPKPELPDTSELTNVKVVDNLAEYARMYLDLVHMEEEPDINLMVVDGSKPINNNTYLAIGKNAREDTKRSYVFISSVGNQSVESFAATVEQRALVTYLRSRNIKVTYNPRELQEWLK